MNPRDLKPFTSPWYLLLFITVGFAVSYVIHIVRHMMTSQYAWSLEDLLISMAGFAIGGTIGWLVIRRMYIKASSHN